MDGVTSSAFPSMGFQTPPRKDIVGDECSTEIPFPRENVNWVGPLNVGSPDLRNVPLSRFVKSRSVQANPSEIPHVGNYSSSPDFEQRDFTLKLLD